MLIFYWAIGVTDTPRYYFTPLFSPPIYNTYYYAVSHFEFNATLLAAIYYTNPLFLAGI